MRRYQRVAAPLWDRRTTSQKSARAAYTAAARKAVIPRLPYATSGYVKRFGETKYIDTQIPNSNGAMPVVGAAAYATPADPFAGIVCLNLIAQGTGFYNRVGQKLVLRGFDIRFSFANAADPTTTNCIIRALLVWDKSPNGTALTIGDLLYSTAAGGSGGTVFNSGISTVNASRFFLLRDQYIEANPGKNCMPQVRWKGRLNLTSHYGANSNPPAIGDIREGALYLIAFYDASAGGATFYDGMGRLAYIDT